MSRDTLLKLQEDAQAFFEVTGEFDDLAEVRYRLQHLGCAEEELWWA